MVEQKISKNLAYNIINQIVSLIVPLILSPYVSRVLSADLIGDYSYALANSSYFVLIEALGLPLYGMLKVSADRDNKEKISTLFWEIMLAKIILMSICIAFYLYFFVYLSDFNKPLCMIMVLNILSTGFDSTWFLSGLEDFRTTTFRNVCVRLANVILVVSLIKSKDDFLLYAFIMQFLNLLSYLIILPTIKKYIVSMKISLKKSLWHVKKSFVYFIPGIINTIFTSADKTVLGAFASSYEVGVYEQATKISSLCGSVINSVSNVMLPRITYLNHNSNKQQVKELLFNSIRYASLFSIIFSAGTICIADEFVPFFFGIGYEKSSILLKILSPNIILNVLANYIGQQCLVSNNKQKKYNLAISISAFLNVIMNLLLVQQFKSIGVSLASVVASIVTLVMVLFFSKRMIGVKDILRMTWKPLVAALIMIGVSFFCETASLMHTILMKLLLCGTVFIFIIIILGDRTVKEIYSKSKNINK